MGTDACEIPTIIQVSNISVHATQEQMKKLFSYMGDIEEIRMYPSKCIQQPQYRICFIKYIDPTSVGIAQHLTNTVFIDRALIVVPFNAKNIPSEEKTYLDLLCPSSAFPGLISSSFNDVINDVDAVDGNLMITSKDPNLEKLGLPQYPPLPANLDPDVIESIRRTVNVSNIGSSITGQRLLNFMNEMVGEVKYLQITGNDNETTKSALVEFTERASVAKALQRDGLMFVNNPLCIKHSTIAITEHNKNKMPIKTGFEEAMKKVKAAENLITAVVEPELEPRSKSRRRHRSSSRSSRRTRSRSRHRRSRSRNRRSRSRNRRSRSRKRRSRSRTRRSRSRPRRSRSRLRRSRSRRRSITRKRRSHSRKRRSLSRKKRSRSRTRRSGSRKRRSYSRKRHVSKERSRDSRSCSNRSVEKESRNRRSESTKRNADKREKKDRSSSIEATVEKPPSDVKKSCSRSRDRSLSAERHRSRSKGRSRSHHSRRSHSKTRSKANHSRRSNSKNRSKSHRRERSSERKSRSHSKTNKRSSSKTKKSKHSKSPDRDLEVSHIDENLLSKNMFDKEENKSIEESLYQRESPNSSVTEMSLNISNLSDDVLITLSNDFHE